MQPIHRVAVVSTGQVQIRHQHEEASGTPQLWWLLTSRRWTPPRPINVYVIEHERGVVLFDTGQDRASVTDSRYFPRGIVGWFYSRLARFDIEPGDTLTEQLRDIGIPIERVTTVILSHVHQDHIGGLPELAHAEIVISEDEWNALDKPGAVLEGFMLDHIRLSGLRWKRIAPEPLQDEWIAPFDAGHDLFGDGALVILPTPGHTAGSLSMLLRQDGMPPLLFVGDLTYSVDLLAAERVPGVGDRRRLAQSTLAVNELRQRHPDLVILAAHDPAAAPLLENALRSIVES